MKQILHKLRVLLLIVWGMCIPSLPGYAITDSEFATWTGVRVDWQLNPRVKFRGTFQTRTQNGLKEMERGRLNVGLNYRVLPLMQLKDITKYNTVTVELRDGKLDIAIKPVLLFQGPNEV